MKKITALVTTLFASVATMGHAQTFEVNSLRGDSDLNDEIVTLADAVIIANTIPGPDIIVFAPALKGTINLQQQLEINESLEIVGPGPSVLTIYMTASDSNYMDRGSIFYASDATENFNISGLTLKHNTSSYLVPRPVSSYAQTNTISNLVLENFQLGIELNQIGSALLENLDFIQCRALARISTLSSPEAASPTVDLKNVVFRSPKKQPVSGDGLSVFQDSGHNVLYERDNISVTVDGMRVTNTDYFVIQTAIGSELDILNSSFDNNGTFVISAKDASIGIKNTTIYNNSATSISLSDDTAAEIAFSTIFFNGGRDGEPVVAVSDSTLGINHSVITVTQNNERVIQGSNSPIDVDYSMIGVTSVPSGPAINYDAVSLSNLLRFPQFEGALESVDGSIFAILPASPGNLLDAGNGSAVVGIDGVPEFDQIGSVRIIGSAPDIGATEYNRPPQFDADAFKAAIKEAIAATPDDIIEIALLDYFTDPDGHNIIDISASNISDGLIFDAGAWTLSGTAEALKRPSLIVIATDEYQLTGGAAIGATSVAADDDSGGSIPMSLLIVLPALLGLRRAKRLQEGH